MRRSNSRFRAGCHPPRVSRIRTHELHPKLGSGAFLLLRIPGIPGVVQDFTLANRLNVCEMLEWSWSRGFGAWCKDVETDDSRSGAVAYVCFVPSLAKMNGLLENAGFSQMAARTKWLHSYFNLPDKNGPDDISWRYGAISKLANHFKRK